MYRLVTFDGVTLPQAAVEAEVGTANTRPALLSYRGGVIDADGADRAAPELPYQLQVHCEIIGTDLATLRTELDALRAKRGVAGILRREGIDDPGTYHWAMARLLHVPEVRGVRNVYYHPLTLTFLVLTQWHGATIDTDVTLTNSRAVPDGTAYDFTLSNNGQLPITNVFFTISTSGSDLTLLRIERDGESGFTWRGTVTAGNQLTIDTASWAVRNNDVIDVAGLRFESWHRIADMVRIPVGGSSYVLTCNGGLSNLHVIYDELYE